MRAKKKDMIFNPNFVAPNGHHHHPFRLPHHHYLVGDPTPGGLIPDPGEGHFRVMRAPDGRKVARKHGDLKPREVSYVLE